MANLKKYYVTTHVEYSASFVVEAKTKKQAEKLVKEDIESEHAAFHIHEIEALELVDE